MLNVLFLRTGNSARSIVAEVLLNDLGRGQFKAYSAGSHPAGQVNPDALQKLSAKRHLIEGLSFKSWDQFGAAGSPGFDIGVPFATSPSGSRNGC